MGVRPWASQRRWAEAEEGREGFREVGARGVATGKANFCDAEISFVGDHSSGALQAISGNELSDGLAHHRQKDAVKVILAETSGFRDFGGVNRALSVVDDELNGAPKLRAVLGCLLCRQCGHELEVSRGAHRTVLGGFAHRPHSASFRLAFVSVAGVGHVVDGVFVDGVFVLCFLKLAFTVGNRGVHIVAQLAIVIFGV